MGLFRKDKIRCCGNCGNRFQKKCMETFEKVKDLSDLCLAWQKH